MARLPIPDLMVRSIYEVSPERLARAGIKLLLLDLDNTLSPYRVDAPTPELRGWIGSVKSAGIEPFLLSNNRGGRPAAFSAALGIGYVGRARKPSVKKLREVLEEKGVTLEQTALAGDQIYTDVLCAARAGIRSVCVRPISMKNPLLALRYWAETPFRAAYKEEKL